MIDEVTPTRISNHGRRNIFELLASSTAIPAGSQARQKPLNYRTHRCSAVGFSFVTFSVICACRKGRRDRGLLGPAFSPLATNLPWTRKLTTSLLSAFHRDLISHGYPCSLSVMIERTLF